MLLTQCSIDLIYVPRFELGATSTRSRPPTQEHDMTKAATKQVEEFTAEAKKTMEEGVEKMARGVEDVTSFSQENVEAMMTSGKVMAKATEEMNAEIIAFSKKSYQDGMAAAKEITSAKSVSEFFEKQTAFAKSAFENYVAEATKLNEIYSSAAKNAFAPLNDRFTAAADMVKTYKA